MDEDEDEVEEEEEEEEEEWQPVMLPSKRAARAGARVSIGNQGGHKKARKTPSSGNGGSASAQRQGLQGLSGSRYSILLALRYKSTKNDAEAPCC